MWELLGFVAIWSDVQVAQGPPNFQLVFEVRAILLGTMALNLWCLMLTLGGYRQNCIAVNHH